MPLPRPCPGELHPVIVVIRKIQTQAHRSSKVKFFSAFIYEPFAPCNGISIGKDSIGERERKPRGLILQIYGQCSRLFFVLCIGGGKPFETRLSAHDLMPFIDKACDPAAVFLEHLHRRAFVIPRSV